MEQALHLQPVLILLVVGILSIAIMRPLHMSPIVGYLIAGMLIGGHGLGLIEESGTTHLLAELGVVFLLFDIGLHFSIGQIWDARRDILGLGPIQVILCTAAFAGLALAAGLSTEIAITLGAALALSSTAVASQLLADNKQSRCPVSVSATAVLIFQDICAIFLLILANSLGRTDVALGQVIGIAAVKGIAAFVAALLIGRYVIGPAFNLISRAKDNEVFTATALLIVLATATATGLFGLSLTLGAFLAGMIIADTPYKHAIQTEVNPFRGLLLGFFFITIGMALDTGVILQQWWIIVLVTLLIVSVKAVLIYAAARLLHMDARSAVQMGVLLSQGSEFAFVIFAMPSMRSALGTEHTSVLIIAVAASMALTPILVGAARRLAIKWGEQDWESGQQATGSEPVPDASVIIVGMSEVGRRVASALDANDIAYRAIEIDHDCFLDACTSGFNVGFGDATDLRLMETIRLSHADTVVITFADYNLASQLTPLVQERYPELHLMVAVDNETDRVRFAALGMQAVVQHSYPRGLDMAAVVLEQYQVGKKRILKWMQRQQSLELEEVPA